MIPLSERQAYCDAWLAVDTKSEGRVGVRALWMHMLQNDSADTCMHRFQHHFDKNKNGYISLDEFCEAIGLPIDELFAERVHLVRPVTAIALPEGVKCITGDLNEAWQAKLAEICVHHLQESINRKDNASMRDVPQKIKKQADELCGKLWHVVMINGQYWVYFSYEPHHSFIFRYEKFIFVLWKTPVS